MTDPTQQETISGISQSTDQPNSTAAAIAETTPATSTFEREILGMPPIPVPQSFWSLLNLSIGFFGIQFAWMIQIMRTSPFLESLGSNPLLTGLIWWAGPITGIVVQPIVGSLSDRTRSKLGRRRPFLIAGMISTAIWLVAMPNAPTLLIAALFLWVLDASINITQGPYRALVPDVVPKHQQAQTFAFMSFFIGLGSIAASYISSQPISMNTLFYIGAVAMMVFMTWTMLTTSEPEQPPVSYSGAETSTQSPGFGAILSQTWQSILDMDLEAKKLCAVHSLTWFGWQCLFIFFSVFVAHQIFEATDPNSMLYQTAIQQASYCFLIWNIVNVVVSAMIPKLLTTVPRKAIHTVGLALMGISLISMHFLTSGLQVAVAMGFLGVGWATTLSIPFAMMANRIPAGKEGVLMGTFNIFIAAPQIIASFFAGLVVAATDMDSTALVLGGVSVLIATFLLQWIDDRDGQLQTQS